MTFEMILEAAELGKELRNNNVDHGINLDDKTRSTIRELAQTAYVNSQKTDRLPNNNEKWARNIDSEEDVDVAKEGSDQEADNTAATNTDTYTEALPPSDGNTGGSSDNQHEGLQLTPEKKQEIEQAMKQHNIPMAQYQAAITFIRAQTKERHGHSDVNKLNATEISGMVGEFRQMLDMNIEIAMKMAKKARSEGKGLNINSVFDIIGEVLNDIGNHITPVGNAKETPHQAKNIEHEIRY